MRSPSQRCQASSSIAVDVPSFHWKRKRQRTTTWSPFTSTGRTHSDRTDFARYGQDLQGRVRAWHAAARASERLAEEFAAWLEKPDPARVEPL